VKEKKISPEIKLLHELFQLASDHAGMGIFYYDLESHPGYFYAQDKTMELIGEKSRPDKLYTNDVWANFMKKQNDQSLMESVLEQFEGTWSGKYEFYDVEYPSNSLNSPKWLSAKAKVTKRDENGKPLNLIGMLIDISEHKRQLDLIELQKKKLEELAYYDHLTGIRNRLAIFEDAKGKSGSIIFLDLDDFKDINDTYGHDVGDYFLKEVALKLTQVTAELSATPYRIGGDEFIIKTCNNMVKEHVINIAKQVIDELKAPVIIKEKEYIISCSIGISFYKDIYTLEDIIHQADLAMYQSKKDGKNQYSLYVPKLNGLNHRRQRSVVRGLK